MKRHAHSLFWFLYWGLALFGALIAAILLTLKILVQDLSSYKSDLADLLSNRLVAQVHIADIKGSWRGWQPVVEVRGLSVDRVKAEPGLSVALLKGQFALDPVASLKMLSPVFSQFDVEGLTARYDLIEATASQPSGERSAGHQGSDSAASSLAFLLQQSSMNFSDTQIVLSNLKGEEISVSPIDLSLRHDGLMHQLKVYADLVTAKGTAKLRFVAETEGNPSREQIDFFFDLERLDHQLINPWLGLIDIELEDLQASQQVWGKAFRGRLEHLIAKTRIKQFKYEDIQLSDFVLDTSLIRKEHSFQFQVNDVSLQAGRSELSLPRLSVDLVREGARIYPQQLMLKKIHLDPIVDWVGRQSFIPEGIKQATLALEPQGVLENVRVKWPEKGSLEDFFLEADLNEVGIEAWDDIPEIKGINGLLNVNKAGGQIHLVSTDFAMHYPTLFDYRWRYPSADGVVGWRFEDQGVVVASQLLHLKDQHVNASGRFSIYLPYDRNEQPLLNLQIGMQASDGLQAKYYIPPQEVGQETYDWLVKAIKAGRINRAGFVLNGVTRVRLPDYQMPAVQLFFDLSEATFEYEPGWPAVKNADGFVFFRNGELTAESTGGYLYDSKIEHAWVHLPVSTEKLLVAGSTAGSAKDIGRLLTKSPLRKEVGDELNKWKMSGRSTTALSLDLPLYTSKLPKVKVTTDLSAGSFSSEADNIHFSSIRGRVVYDSKRGLSASKLNAQLFDRAVSAKIESSANKTQVTIDGQVETNTLRQWLELDLLKVAKGELAYQAVLDMCPGKACDQLSVTSDLQGVALAAPEPFRKDAESSMPFNLISDLGRQYQDNRSAIRLNLDNKLRGIIVAKGNDVERARFTFGGARPAVPAKPGIWMDGEVMLLDYEQLDDFLTVAGFIGAADNERGRESDSAGLKQVDLDIGTFVLQGHAIDALSIKLQPVDQGWLLETKSPNIQGSLLIPEAPEQVYRIKLDRLVLNRENDEEIKEDLEESVSVEADLQPTEVPRVDFSVDEFVINERSFGSWRFFMEPTQDGAVIKQIEADMHGATVSGELRWIKAAEEYSDLTVKLDSQDFRPALKAWKLNEAIETKKLNAYLQLNWSGAPWAFELPGLGGEIQFKARQGRILDVGQSGNFLRIFGILNLQSLGRRLRLDFSDLFKSGVTFDEMSANYKIEKGVATTTEPFLMTGPSANMAMQGDLDLVNETVDKNIEVALPVTDNIPLVSVLLGAPQVAGAVFLFDKLIGDPLAKFSTIKYRMTGDWSNPVIDVKDAPKAEEDPNPNTLERDING